MPKLPVPLLVMVGVVQQGREGSAPVLAPESPLVWGPIVGLGVDPSELAAVVSDAVWYGGQGERSPVEWVSALR